jgi:hypothetical protein
VVLGAGVEVVGAAGFHLGIGAGLGHALAVEVEPGEAALDVGEVAVGGVGVERDELVEVFESRVEFCGGSVAECGGVVKSGPGGGVETRLGDDDGRGGGGDGGAAVATMTHHVDDEDADDDGEKDVVAGTELHKAVGRG